MPSTRSHSGSRRLRGVILLGFVSGAALSRLVPHPPNLTSIGAMALFGGAFSMGRDRRSPPRDVRFRPYARGSCRRRIPRADGRLRLHCPALGGCTR
jgi:hypothetical protein